MEWAMGIEPKLGKIAVSNFKSNTDAIVRRCVAPECVATTAVAGYALLKLLVGKERQYG
jgi:hypothetical protein